MLHHLHRNCAAQDTHLDEDKCNRPDTVLNSGYHLEDAVGGIRPAQKQESKPESEMARDRRIRLDL